MSFIDDLLKEFSEKMNLKITIKQIPLGNSWFNCNINNLNILFKKHFNRFQNNFELLNPHTKRNNERLLNDLIDIANYCLFMYKRIQLKGIV